MEHLSEVKTLLSTPRKVVITMHAHPDADALGSSLAWYHYLLKLGHTCSVIAPDEYPDFLKWMEGHEAVWVYDEQTTVAQEKLREAEVVFCMDFSGLKRVQSMETDLSEATGTKIVIDHHQNPEDFARYMFHNRDAAATAEIVFEVIQALGDENLIDVPIAECLYAGLMTDTGSFKHPNTTPRVHRIAAALMEHGADAAKVSQQVYDNNSLNRLRFLGYALNTLLEVDLNHGVAYFVISDETRNKFQLASGDTEGLVNYALSIKGIKVAALFKEKNGEIKMSFRSVGDIQVNKFAEDYFEGGGHKNAAGGKSDLSLEETLEKFKSLVNENVFAIG